MFSGVLVLSLFLTVQVTRSTLLAICDEGTRYEYDIEQCPGGIQIRDVNHWFSMSRENTCICGEGSMLQFNGKTEEWHKIIYPKGYGGERTVLGSWDDYSLRPACELIKGNHSSALFINAKKYQNPANFPSRAIDLIVEDFEKDRVAGSFKIAMLAGRNRRSEPLLYELLRTIILNNQEPLLIVEDPKEQFKQHVCAYNDTNPEVILTKYITTTWGNQDLAENCEKKVYKPYTRPTYICPVNCEKTKKFEPPPKQPGVDQPVLAFRQIMLTMAEIAMRMRHADKFVTFQQKDHPYAALLQHSCRVFHRAFPNVVRWETLLNAVTLFGVAFEGLVPTSMQKEMFEQIKILLGRCTIQEGRRESEHNKLVAQLCPSVEKEVELELNSSVATVNRKPSGAGAPGDGQPAKMRISFGGPHNIVIELLWKVVQFTHASCLPATDHYPNVHHFYTNAMIELFSAPAVQLLWYQQEKYDFRQLGKAMVHIFPELPDHVLPTMELLLQKLRFNTHFNVLQRPKIPNLDERDMRCAGHGKLIWGGKACCYQKSEDKKFYYFNKVAFGKL